jgi:D-glycero-alpha-D-manno-heptose-7-phosphate kinase
MIISRTPYRISFFGGGTDYPSWYRHYGGQVIATTIDKYCYISARYLPPFFDHRFRIVYSRIENCKTVDEIAHPAVRECLRYLQFEQGLEIHHDGDLPARSGLGSSSSFVVGLLHALHALSGAIPAKERLAHEAIHMEQVRLKETVGSQDQVMAAHGGFQRVEFLSDGEIRVTPLTLRPDRLKALNSHLMLFFTGIKRTATTIAESYASDVASVEKQLRTMGSMVDEAFQILAGSSDLATFGNLLHEAWRAKRSLSKQVSNPVIDEIYATARSAGALGGKLIGAGGGGFMLLFAHPADHDRIRERLAKLVHVPFRFERAGSRIIFFDRGEDYAAQAQQRLLKPVETFRESTAVFVGASRVRASRRPSAGTA